MTRREEALRILDTIQNIGDLVDVIEMAIEMANEALDECVKSC